MRSLTVVLVGLLKYADVSVMGVPPVDGPHISDDQKMAGKVSEWRLCERL